MRKNETHLNFGNNDKVEIIKRSSKIYRKVNTEDIDVMDVTFEQAVTSYNTDNKNYKNNTFAKAYGLYLIQIHINNDDKKSAIDKLCEYLDCNNFDIGIKLRRFIKLLISNSWKPRKNSPKCLVNRINDAIIESHYRTLYSKYNNSAAALAELKTIYKVENEGGITDTLKSRLYRARNRSELNPLKPYEDEFLSIIEELFLNIKEGRIPPE